jgi:putative membrane protein
MNHIKTALLQVSLITAALVAATSCSNTQKPSDDAGKTGSSNSDTIKMGKDAQFVITVAGINLEEIKLGQLAQQKSSITDVKELGKMMVDEHTKAQSDLTILAVKESITLPTTLDSNAQNAYKKLNDLSGSDFDKQYCDMMVNGHKDAIALFENESANASDTAIKQMAVATLPTLHKHLDHAMMCKKEYDKM